MTIVHWLLGLALVVATVAYIDYFVDRPPPR